MFALQISMRLPLGEDTFSRQTRQSRSVFALQDAQTGQNTEYTSSESSDDDMHAGAFDMHVAALADCRTAGD